MHDYVIHISLTSFIGFVAYWAELRNSLEECRQFVSHKIIILIPFVLSVTFGIDINL